VSKRKASTARDADIRVRIPKRLKDKLRAISDRKLLSMSDVAIQALVELLGRFDETGAPIIAEDAPEYGRSKKKR